MVKSNLHSTVDASPRLGFLLPPLPSASEIFAPSAGQISTSRRERTAGATDCGGYILPSERYIERVTGESQSKPSSPIDLRVTIESEKQRLLPNVAC